MVVCVGAQLGAAREACEAEIKVAADGALDSDDIRQICLAGIAVEPSRRFGRSVDR